MASATAPSPSLSHASRGTELDTADDSDTENEDGNEDGDLVANGIPEKALKGKAIHVSTKYLSLPWGVPTADTSLGLGNSKSANLICSWTATA